MKIYSNQFEVITEVDDTKEGLENVNFSDITKRFISLETQVSNMFIKSNNDISFKGNMVPDADDTWSIGSSTKKLAELHISANTIYLGDGTQFKGHSVTITGEPNPTSMTEQPILTASRLIAKPWKYNPGSGEVKVRPSIEFEGTDGNRYPISFNTDDNSFSFDAKGNYGEGWIVARKLTLEDSGQTALSVRGHAEFEDNVKIRETLKVYGNTTLGDDSSNTITVRGILDITTPILFKTGATLGDGNDTIAVNAGTQNNFTVLAKNFELDGEGIAKVSNIEIAGKSIYEIAGKASVISDTDGDTQITTQSCFSETWQPNYPYELKNIVKPTVSNGHYYKPIAITGDGRSGSTEPVWPTEVGSKVIDNQVEFQEYDEDITRFLASGKEVARIHPNGSFDFDTIMVHGLSYCNSSVICTPGAKGGGFYQVDRKHLGAEKTAPVSTGNFDVTGGLYDKLFTSTTNMFSSTDVGNVIFIIDGFLKGAAAQIMRVIDEKNVIIYNPLWTEDMLNVAFSVVPAPSFAVQDGGAVTSVLGKDGRFFIQDLQQEWRKAFHIHNRAANGNITAAYIETEVESFDRVSSLNVDYRIGQGTNPRFLSVIKTHIDDADNNTNQVNVMEVSANKSQSNKTVLHIEPGFDNVVKVRGEIAETPEKAYQHDSNYYKFAPSLESQYNVADWQKVSMKDSILKLTGFNFADIKGYWKFNNNLIDSSGNNHNGSGSPSYVTGKLNQAIDMSDTISLGNHSDLDLSNTSFTITLWFYPNKMANKMMFHKALTSSPWNGFVVRGSYWEGDIEFICYWDGGDETISISDAPSNNNWHQLVITYNGSTVKMYLDSSLKTSENVTLGNFSNTRNFTLGGELDGWNGNQFDGYMDEMSIWKRELSHSEIIYLYNNGSGYEIEPNQTESQTVTNKTGIDLADWTGINEVKTLTTNPSGTSIKFLFSVDGGTVWNKWSGSAWNSAAIGDIETQGNTSTEITQLTSANWLSLTTGKSSLHWATNLKTTVPMVTPILQEISFHSILKTMNFSNTVLFSSIHNYILIGRSKPFGILELMLTTKASNSVGIQLEYSTGNNTWKPLTFSDQTSELKTSGKLSFSPPSDWVAITEIDGQTIPSHYYIKMNRTLDISIYPVTEDMKIYETSTRGEMLIRGDGTIKPAQLENSEAVNNSIYYNGTNLVFKDPTGVIKTIV